MRIPSGGVALHLIIFFAEQLGLALSPSSDLAQFRADGVPYRDGGAGDITATYDCLRDADGRLAGVLLWCVPESAGLGPALDQLAPAPSYLVSFGGPPSVYAVLFRPLPPDEAAQLESGGEQAFGGWIFRGEDGGVAVSIDLGYLLGGDDTADADLAAVRAASARWLTITRPIETSAADA